MFRRWLEYRGFFYRTEEGCLKWGRESVPKPRDNCLGACEE